jgi:ubiquinone/menaquinone biosynthesis C-methylase UbiE/DNA-binding transcriptional ArsR family regulator
MDDLLKILKALAEPSRLRLLALCMHGEFTVTELVHILGQSQPRVSRHLKLLCDAGLLQKIREGSWMLYRFAPDDEVASTVEHLLTLVPADDSTFVSDQKRLGEVKAERSKSATDYFRFSAEQWDKIRGLHVDEAKIEDAIRQIFLADQINRFLDIGTGTGRMLELVGDHAEKIDGIDQSTEMLAVARANLDRAQLKNCTLRQGDMYHLPGLDNEFDAACIHQVLHFADEPNRVIAEAARVLQPGGKLVVVDFAPHEIEELRKNYHHRRLGFSDGEFVHWFQRNGLNFKPPVHLSGGQLTVTIWTGIKKLED